MKQIPIREFQLHAERYLKELPITLTRYGKVVAGVSAIDDKFEYVDIGKKIAPVYTVDGFKVSDDPKKWRGEELSTSNPKLAVGSFMEQKKIKMCKHGSALGNCKFGCTK